MLGRVLCSIVSAGLVFVVENFINALVIPYPYSGILVEATLIHAFVVFWVAFIAYGLGKQSKDSD